MSEVSDPMNNLRAYTDYPITELGDTPNQTAPVRKVVLLSYDCLLYTSPSPRDRQKSRMPSSA